MIRRFDPRPCVRGEINAKSQRLQAFSPISFDAMYGILSGSSEHPWEDELGDPRALDEWRESGIMMAHRGAAPPYK